MKNVVCKEAALHAAALVGRNNQRLIPAAALARGQQFYMPVFRNISSAKRTGENGLIGIEWPQSAGLSQEAQAQSGFSDNPPGISAGPVIPRAILA
jgi:hypothetical protein